MSMVDVRAPGVNLPRLQTRILIGVSIAALALAAAARLRQDPGATLWLDESWTGAFVSQPTLAAVTEQVRNDANAPAYYYLMWVWARAFGISNVSLHVPSMLAGLLTPWIAWLGLRRSHPTLALTWAVLLASWLPGIEQSNDARCYALLLGAAVVSTLSQLRLLEAPSLGRAAIWAATAAFMTLVHYYAGVLALAQGLAFVALHRGRALRLWPAALCFLPAFVWIGFHAARIADFARPDAAWYDRVQLNELLLCFLFLAGAPSTLMSFVAALVTGACMKPGRRQGAPEVRDRAEAALWWVGWSAAAAAASCVAIGVLRPTLAVRYLTPFVPGTSLLAMAWAIRIGSRPCLALSAMTFGSLVAVAMSIASRSAPTQRVYNFEVASAWLAESRPARLVFFWDHPSTPVETRSQLDVIGGFFLRRSGLPLVVTPVYPTGDDMNGPVAAAAGSDAAVLWMYDVLMHHTSAAMHLPRLPSLVPGLECQDFGQFNIGIVACRRPPIR